ncbi:hypothetical protein D3C72_442930 [compost metagenome]
MPIPLLLVGAAVAAGAFGVKKGVDAHSDMKEAEAINREARQIYDAAKDRVDAAREQTNCQLEAHGRLKAEVLASEMKQFEALAQQASRWNTQDEFFTKEDMFRLKNETMSAADMLAGGAAAMGGGALAGMAALGSAAVLGTASTGTAIAGLSGVAATNATLAWLGGGSLAAGGMGMAGGAAVLGGIIAGPLLAAGGMFLAAKAEESLDNARDNRRKAKDAAEKLSALVGNLKAVDQASVKFQAAITKLRPTFQDQLTQLRDLLAVSGFDGPMGPREKQILSATSRLAKVMKIYLDTPLMSSNGEYLSHCEQALEEANRLLEKLARGVGDDTAGFDAQPVF